MPKDGREYYVPLVPSLPKVNSKAMLSKKRPMLQLTKRHELTPHETASK